MVRINLLPVKQIKKVLKARNELIRYFFGLLLLFVLIGIVAFLQIFIVDNLNATIKDLEIEKSSYQSTIREIEKLKKDKAKLDTKLAMIKKLKKGSHITVRVLDEIANITPSNRLWLNSLVQSPNSLQLSGVALDNATIAQFMQRLKTSKYFVSAELANSSLMVVEGRKLKSFSLSCGMISTETEEETETK